MDGDISNAQGFCGSEAWNMSGGGVAAPFGISTWCLQIPGGCGLVQDALRNANKWKGMTRKVSGDASTHPELRIATLGFVWMRRHVPCAKHG